MSGYFGSKATSGLFQNIIAIMPPHGTYIETHLGGGTIMKKKPPTIKNIGIDLNSQSLANFKCDFPIELINECAHKFLSRYKYTGNELLYCDPPYLIETRASTRKYQYDYTVKDHIKLLNLLNSLPCQIILSGYPSSLYDEHLIDWNKIELQAMTQAGPRTEVLRLNYKIDKAYWPTYAGKNFTDRQRIKRKAHRWGTTYKSLPNAERLAILATMMNVEASIDS